MDWKTHHWKFEIEKNVIGHHISITFSNTIADYWVELDKAYQIYLVDRSKVIW